MCRLPCLLKVGTSSFDVKAGDCFDYEGNVDGAKIPSNEAWDASTIEWELLGRV